jgi:hypothetical protein
MAVSYLFSQWHDVGMMFLENLIFSELFSFRLPVSQSHFCDFALCNLFVKCKTMSKKHNLTLQSTIIDAFAKSLKRTRHGTIFELLNLCYSVTISGYTSSHVFILFVNAVQ